MEYCEYCKSHVYDLQEHWGFRGSWGSCPSPPEKCRHGKMQPFLKRYWVFVYIPGECQGGLGDVVECYDTKGQARARARGELARPHVGKLGTTVEIFDRKTGTLLE